MDKESQPRIPPGDVDLTAFRSLTDILEVTPAEALQQVKNNGGALTIRKVNGEPTRDLGPFEELVREGTLEIVANNAEYITYRLRQSAADNGETEEPGIRENLSLDHASHDDRLQRARDVPARDENTHSSPRLRSAPAPNLFLRIMVAIRERVMRPFAPRSSSAPPPSPVALADARTVRLDVPLREATYRFLNRRGRASADAAAILDRLAAQRASVPEPTGDEGAATLRLTVWVRKETVHWLEQHGESTSVAGRLLDHGVARRLAQRV